MENQKNSKGIIVVLMAVIVILFVLCILFATNTISFNSKTINSNSSQTNMENNDNNITDNQGSTNTSNENTDNFYGTYYNSDYNDEYFVLNSDNTAIIVTSTCSNGNFPPKTVAYKITKENGKMLLAIDINNNQKYEDTYTGTKIGDEYRFKPNTLGCTEEEDTYYIKSNVPSNVYGTYYNSDYNDEYFKLNDDNTCVIVTSTCSNGKFPLKTVAYKLINTDKNLLLFIDINNNQKYEDTYTGTKVGDEYHFKPDTLGCTEEENTYYSKK